MKRAVERVLFVVIGFVVCCALIVGLSARSAMIIAQKTPACSAENLSEDEQRLHNRICKLFLKGDEQEMIRLLRIDKGELGISINGESLFRQPRTPIAELVVENLSERNIVVYEPRIHRVAPVDAGGEGVRMRTQYEMTFLFNENSRCRVLKPGQRISFPTLFQVGGTGEHLVTMSVQALGGVAVSGESTTWEYMTLTNVQYRFSVVEATSVDKVLPIKL